MPSKSLGETLLRGAARITAPLAQHDLARRVARGDEDASRLDERRGNRVCPAQSARLFGFM